MGWVDGQLRQCGVYRLIVERKKKGRGQHTPGSHSNLAQPCDRSLNNFIGLGLGAVLRGLIGPIGPISRGGQRDRETSCQLPTVSTAALCRNPARRHPTRRITACTSP